MSGLEIKIAAFFMEKGPFKEKISQRRITLKDVWNRFLVGFFDGVCSAWRCGGGMLIALSLGEIY